LDDVFIAFTLTDIDHAHPYVRQRGLKEKTARTFGARFFPGPGGMSGRVVIPISNERGELIAYAGRSIDGSEPKYKLPMSPAACRKSKSFAGRSASKSFSAFVMVRAYHGRLELQTAPTGARRR
jgi:hypothetical protein